MNSQAGAIDYDLHGWVGVRVVDATPAEVAVVDRQFGPIRGTLDRAPDLILRFVDRLEPAGRLRYLGLEEAAFTDDAFLLLRTKYGTRARVQIPFEQVGGRCEIVCERGIRTIPLLIPLLNLTALGKGLLPLHASAFRYRGVGVLVTGWSKGGKTEALLAFMARGAEYIGDEWVYVSPDGDRMFGIPRPFGVWDWHLRELPEYRVRLRRRERVQLSVFRVLQTAGRAAQGATRNHVLASRLLRLILPEVDRRLSLSFRPPDLFGPAACSFAGCLDRIILVMSHEAAETVVSEAEPCVAIERMLFSLRHEQRELMAHYLQFRFAFPERSSALLESIEAVQRRAIARVLEGRRIFVVSHPYPVPLSTLSEEISSLVAPTVDERAFQPFCAVA